MSLHHNIYLVDMKTLLPGLLLLLLTTASVYPQGTLVGGPCEGCEAIFEYEGRSLSPVDTLAGFAEASEKMKVTGTIYQQDGHTPASGVILYIYHANAEGVYPTRGDETGWARRHGYIRGWIKTGPHGRYTFYTQKPGSYSRNPAHIHPTILEPDGTYYYIDTYVFKGDPLLGQQRLSQQEPRGGSGIATLTQENGMLVARRDIVLGLHVPGYK